MSLRAGLDRVTAIFTSATVARHHCCLGDKNNSWYIRNDSLDSIISYCIYLQIRQIKRYR